MPQALLRGARVRVLGEVSEGRPERGGAPASRGMKPRLQFSQPTCTGWTVFEIPSTPWVLGSRPIGRVRPKLAASQERLPRQARILEPPCSRRAHPSLRRGLYWRLTRRMRRS